MTALRDFLELPYDELEELNLQSKRARLERRPFQEIQEEKIRFLQDHKQIKAVTVCFSDLEGRLQMLDYDKKHILANQDMLTFDGSSVSGFQSENGCDLRLAIDWPAFYVLPSDVFGPGKVMVFAEVHDGEGKPFPADLRARLNVYTKELYDTHRLTCYVAPEVEGFLFQGNDAEQRYVETGQFDYVSIGGYYHSLPGDHLRVFIDTAAEVQRAMAFENEKDHPEVAPSQFEINFSYSDALISADQVLLYKLICRQVAAKLGMTASFLPKPVAGVNGTGMHTNISISKHGKNLFYDPNGTDQLSAFGWEAVDKIMNHAKELCLILNPSVNAYRRLDARYEAPVKIRCGAADRSAMVRIPAGNERSKRIEVRAVAPDANPYAAFYTLIRTIMEGTATGQSPEALKEGHEPLPSHIYGALDYFSDNPYVKELLTQDVQEKYAFLKRESADRCPHILGNLVKKAEIQFHHEVTNQVLWARF